MVLFPHPIDLRRRAGGLAFTLFFNGLLLLALFTLAPDIMPPRPDDRLPVTFDIAPGQEVARDREQAQKSETADREKTVARAPQRRQERPTPRPAELAAEPVPEPPSLPFLVLSRDQMASADIGRMPGKQSVAGQADSRMAAGPGEGPGGVQLFPADWYREPSDAELSPYLPANRPPNGWGEVACKTVDHFQVDNCQQLGESPPGSGFARAVRLAAWQFRVRPPRVNGKPMVGTWVRIRIDYSTRTGAGDGVPGGR